MKKRYLSLLFGFILMFTMSGCSITPAYPKIQPTKSIENFNTAEIDNSPIDPNSMSMNKGTGVIYDQLDAVQMIGKELSNFTEKFQCIKNESNGIIMYTTTAPFLKDFCDGDSGCAAVADSNGKIIALSYLIMPNKQEDVNADKYYNAYCALYNSLQVAYGKPNKAFNYQVSLQKSEILERQEGFDLNDVSAACKNGQERHDFVTSYNINDKVSLEVTFVASPSANFSISAAYASVGAKLPSAE
jgi:hypothetical protein